MKNLFKYNIIFLFTLLFLVACQDMEKPELGEFPVDVNDPNGPLKFYTAFDGTTSNSLMNAVDSIRAKFPSINPLTTVDGISGKALQFEQYKYVKYSAPNNFASTASSFSVSFWEKLTGTPMTSHIFSIPATSGYHWSGSTMFLLVEGSTSDPIVKFFVKDSSGEKWFEWIPGNSTNAVLKNIMYDGNWHHMVFSYDATTSGMTLYIDGIAGATSTWTGHGGISLEPSKINGFKIGAGPQEFSDADIAAGATDWLKNSFPGQLDQFRLYVNALSAVEIQALYNAKK